MASYAPPGPSLDRGRWRSLLAVVGTVSIVVSGCSLLGPGLPTLAWPVLVPPSAPAVSSDGTVSPGPASSPIPGRTQRPTPPPINPLGGWAPYVVRGPASHRWIALTLDEDMRPSMYATRDTIRWYDPRIIDLLERTGTPATIFHNGLFAKAYPSILRRLAADPQIELANHTWDHQGWTIPCTPNDLPIDPPLTKQTEVTKTARLVRSLTGVKLRYFRFPAGCHSSADVRLVRSLGEISIGWSCYFGDALGYPIDRQVSNVEQTCGRGAIVVTHLDGPPYHYGVYEALRQLIPWWKQHGWKVVTVGTMLGGRNTRH